MTSQPRALLHTAVDPDALLDHTSDRDRQVHRAVVEALQSHGILTLGRGQSDTLFEAVARLGNDSKTLWVKTISRLNDLNRIDRDLPIPSLADSLASSSPADAWVGILDLVVAGEVSGQRHGVEIGAGSRTLGGVDLVLAATIDESPALEAASKVGHFPARTPRKEISAQFLRPLAVRSSAVKLIDPHLLEEFIREDKFPAHVEWLLTELAEVLPPGASISLLGKLQREWPNGYLPDPETRVSKFLSETLSHRSLPLTVEVRFAKHTDLQNRYIWFSCGRSYDVLHLFAPLTSEPIGRELRFIPQDPEAAAATLAAAAKLEAATREVVTVTYEID